MEKVLETIKDIILILFPFTILLMIFLLFAKIKRKDRD